MENIGECNAYHRPARLLCSRCRIGAYCSQECQRDDYKQHKHICRLDETVARIADQIDILSLGSFSCRNPGGISFGLSEAQCQRGEIIEEGQAQEICYDAMETYDLNSKVKLIVRALDVFPLSTEAWSMLGAFYRWDLPKGKRDFTKGKDAYQRAIECARKLNPTLGADRTEPLEWGLMYTRPYLRAIQGRALCLWELGEVQTAIDEAKFLLRLNPNDNQGMRQLLCSWMMVANDTDVCLELFQDFDYKQDSNLAYTNVLLQFQRWKKGEVPENAVTKALVIALENNVHIPDMLIQEDEPDTEGLDYVDVGGPKEAMSYCKEAHSLWRQVDGALEWLQTIKNKGGPVPSEQQLITLLKKHKILFKCTSKSLKNNRIENGFILASQNKKKMSGTALPDFFWPPEMDQTHSNGSKIFVNVWFEGWRELLYCDVDEVPFWEMLLTL